MYRIVKTQEGFKIQKRTLFIWFYVFDHPLNEFDYTDHLIFKTKKKAKKYIRNRN